MWHLGHHSPQGTPATALQARELSFIHLGQRHPKIVAHMAALSEARPCSTDDGGPQPRGDSCRKHCRYPQEQQEKQCLDALQQQSQRCESPCQPLHILAENLTRHR